MFTVKHETPNYVYLYQAKQVAHCREGIDTNEHVMLRQKVDGEGKMLCGGTVYVMNESGKTVEIYRLPSGRILSERNAASTGYSEIGGLAGRVQQGADTNAFTRASS